MVQTAKIEASLMQIKKVETLLMKKRALSVEMKTIQPENLCTKAQELVKKGAQFTMKMANH